MAALVHDEKVSFETYQKIFENRAFDKALRMSAFAACAIKNEKIATVSATIFAVAKKLEDKAKEKRQQQIQNVIASTHRLKGNPSVGKAVFQSRLACHKVRDTGHELAPPLDGGNKRVTEHLITAIVNPDVAFLKLPPYSL